jgi:apolipoprotein D and lipocalin family protein
MKPLLLPLLLLIAALPACRSMPVMPTPAPQVDLPRYMGDWYVIGSIPSPLEKDAYNAVETYTLDADGTIGTTFTFNKGSSQGKSKQLKARGFVKDRSTNSIWGMQFVWPIKADYRIAWIAPDYSQVVVAREKRDYLWIMARTPQLPDAEYQRLTEFAGSLGYDISQIRKVPQTGNATR